MAIDSITKVCKQSVTEQQGRTKWKNCRLAIFMLCIHNVMLQVRLGEFSIHKIEFIGLQLPALSQNGPTKLVQSGFSVVNLQFLYFVLPCYIAVKSTDALYCSVIVCISIYRKLPINAIFCSKESVIFEKSNLQITLKLAIFDPSTSFDLDQRQQVP